MQESLFFKMLQRAIRKDTQTWLFFKWVPKIELQDVTLSEICFLQNYEIVQDKDPSQTWSRYSSDQLYTDITTCQTQFKSVYSKGIRSQTHHIVPVLVVFGK